MKIRLDESENAAWDTYFSAALATAKSNGLPTNKGLDDQWLQAVELAARIADKMIIERRERTSSVVVDS